MKRLVLSLLAVLLLAGAGAFLLHQRAPQVRQVATWLPGNTIFLEDMPDLQRTAERWPATALAQIINEPEVQAFLQRPMDRLPDRPELDKRLAEVAKINPGHFFLAVTDWSGAGGPKTIAGLSYKGSKEDMDSVVDELRGKAQAAWPSAKSDIEKYGSGEIETFTTPALSTALAYRDQWVFIATDKDLLKATLDRYDGKAQPDSLAELPVFKGSLQHLPDGPDNVLFLRPSLLADKASSLALMLNPTADMSQMDSLKKIDAVNFALKLDGEEMRDAAYIIKAQPGDDAPLARDSLKLSSSDTVVATSGRIQSIGAMQMPDPRSDPSGVLQLLESYLKTFQDKGLGLEQLSQAFGPETGFVLDWPPGAMIPTPLAMVDVRDPAKARKFLDTLATLPIAAGANFTRRDEGGISFYSLPQTGIGFFPLQITLGLTDKGVIAALETDAVKQAGKRWDAGGTGLEEMDAYKKAAALVQGPTMSFTYVDTKTIFERLYGLFRGVASMGFVPHLSEYVDIAKLPVPETISRHLSPIVASGAVKDGGMLWESAGPVSSTQAVFVTAVTLGAVAVPLIEQQLKGQSVTIPGLPGFGSQPGNGAPNPLNKFTSPSGQRPFVNPPSSGASPAQGVP